MWILQAVEFEGYPLFWDTSDCKILQDPRPEDYSYYAEKCRGKGSMKNYSSLLESMESINVCLLLHWGFLLYEKQTSCFNVNFSDLGERWGPFIMDFCEEIIILDHSVSQDCLLYWIGGSTNVSSPDPTMISREDQRIMLNDYIRDDSGK